MFIMSKQPVEIICPECGEESFLKHEPLYNGFVKTGERLSCISCGHVFPGEGEIPFKKNHSPAIFSDADKSAPLHVFDKDDISSKPQVFEQGENARLCRYCAHYVVNPFIQRCARHGREVEATDTCAHFTQRKDPAAGGRTCL